MTKAEEVRILIDRWLEIYNEMDKRTKEAKDMKIIIEKLLKFVGEV